MGILLVGILAINAWFLAKPREKEENLAGILLSFSIFFYTQIIGFLLVLGLIGQLGLPNLTLLAGFLSVYLIGQERRHTFCYPASQTCIRLNFSPLVLFFLALVLSAYFVLLQSQAPYPGLPTDALLYHLPFAARWYQTGKVAPVPLVFSDIAMSYYPINGDLIFLFHFLLFGNDFLIRFQQLPFGLMAGLSLFLLFRKSGISPEKSLTGACLLLLFRPFVRQAIITFVDLMLVGFFLSACYYFSQPGRKNLLLGCLSAGLMLGTKNTGGLLLIPLAFLVYRRGSPKNQPFSFSLLVTGAFLFLFLGGYKYLHNLFLTGNPFYPAAISLGPVRLPGFYQFTPIPLSEKIKTALAIFKKPLPSVDASRSTSLLLFLFWLAGIISWKKNSGKFFLATPILILILYVSFIPPNYFQLRHLLSVYPFLLMGAIFFLESVSEKFSSDCQMKNLLWAGLGVFFMADSVAFYPPLVRTMFSVSLGLFLVFLTINKLKSIWLRLVILIAMATTLLVSVIIWWPAATLAYKDNRGKILYRAYGQQAELWFFLDQLSGNRKKVIAYVGDFLIYPFSGYSLGNQVYHQPVNSLEERLVHTYHPEPISFPADIDTLASPFRQNPEIGIWLAGLKKHKADFVVVRFRPGRKAIEEYWMENHPFFKLIFANDWGKVYQVSYQKD
ncbi:MAG: glycosyltransferase family 39 protein [Candidatus Omnitrophica bacterium]|nr:glycosyltransferase family 39 protein [Candidatus Omnitrophota bacterium]